MVEYKWFSVTEGEVTTLRFLTRRLAGQVAEELTDELVAFFRAQRPSRAVIDFEGVVFVSSEAINALCMVVRSVRDYDGALMLCGMHDDIRRVFSLLRLDEKLFSICEDRSAAMVTFRGKDNATSFSDN